MHGTSTYGRGREMGADINARYFNFYGVTEHKRRNTLKIFDKELVVKVEEKYNIETTNKF